MTYNCNIISLTFVWFVIITWFVCLWDVYAAGDLICFKLGLYLVRV